MTERNNIGIVGCPNFTLKEFEDPDTGFVNIHPILPRTLQAFRDFLNEAMCQNCVEFVLRICGATNQATKTYDHCEYWKGKYGEHSIHITSACRTWPTHVRIYQKKYPKDWQAQIPPGSKHLIEKPGIAYYDADFNMSLRIYEEQHKDRQWTCVGADIQIKRPDGTIMGAVEAFYAVNEFGKFDYTYACGEHAIHVDMRKSIGA